MPSNRAILHVDMDAFFASVEQLDDPSLRGKPVLVGGTGPRGVVAAASYEARKFGIHSAMPSAVARRLCPHAVFVKGSFARYKELSSRVFEILESYTPRVQPVSIDEAFMDVTGSTTLMGDPVEIARSIRATILERTGLTASVGVAPNKFLAKLASDLDKPDGLTVFEIGQVQSKLDPLGVSRIWGVGPAAERKLRALGVRTIGELRALPRETLDARFGSYGERLWRLSRGLDDRPVHTDREAKSISHERTFAQNLTDPDEIRSIILDLGELVARRLRRHGRYAKTINVKIRFGDFETVTRASTLEAPTDRTGVIASEARGLFDVWARSFRSVRLIGVGVSQLSEGAGQGSLFGQEQRTRDRAVDRASDEITRRFGAGAIRLGGALRAPAKHGAHGPGSDTPTELD